ncbi:hypothetical protein ASPZODRAFT_139573 [Penicilliopsis zonata CBS 506.65]|uniref:Major facilitator superfamily (MFS) profile domain-containing protein n=1 Tax=Penicilliopsis zonata CBS 506.65 TaxID=1073090 RepID=A0A1L9SSU3_9EURO|nr:hypothetical protein ASPZODRAFT_139573 [Penicilliopsis zonata CBS 506.65]OJJ50259.1 hypothetical protein ASPZODRAFT_139573 [Penicilliopsis zonata CBS 506.65]
MADQIVNEPPAGERHVYDEKLDRSDDDSGENGNYDQINMQKNASAKVQNPLAHLSKSHLLRDVDEFANEFQLTEILPLLRKGALVARDPANFEAVEGLDQEEIQAIHNEKLHRWRQPWRLYFTIILCSIGAAVQGWDQTGSNGANLSFPQALGIPDSTGDAHAARNEWLIGTINSGPYLGSAVIGCWLSDPLNNWLGRRPVIFIAGLFCVITPIGSAFAQTWPQLFIIRILLGIGMGLKASTVPIFCAENCPAAIRGGLVMSWQMWTAFGLFLGYSANLAVEFCGSITWRLQLGSAFIPAVPLVLGVFFCPESPRWYIKKGRLAEAYKSLVQLRNNDLQAARDLYYIYAQIKIEREIVGNSNYVQRFIELFTIPRVRRATLASGVVMLAQQMCGINIMAFYSSTIFSDAGASARNALLASWGWGLINFLFAFPAIWTIDTYGRRTLLLLTFPQMAWSLLVAGACFYIPENETAHLGLIAFFVYVFTAFYSPGEGPVPFTYSAEVFPLSHREVGMSWAVATCLGWAAVLTITFPRMLAVMTPMGAFGFYAGLNVTAFVMIYLWVPETKQRTLEELDYVFAVPTRVHMHYQVFKALPWWFRKYIFRQDVHLEPLYKFDELHEKKEVREVRHEVAKDVTTYEKE